MLIEPLPALADGLNQFQSINATITEQFLFIDIITIRSQGQFTL